MYWRVVLGAGVAVCLAGQAVSAPIYVPGLVPDWNQPYWYNAASLNGGPGPDPNPGLVDPWNAWCAPTSASNCAGHWDDQYGAPCADGTAHPGSTVNWAAGASWQDFLADGFARPALGLPATPTDVGYYMDTNNLGLPSGNPPHAGTHLKDIDIGLWRYLQAGQPGVWTTGTQGRGYASGVASDGVTAAALHPNPISAFAEIVGEINAGRTLLVSWAHWNIIPAGPPPLPPTGQDEASYPTYFYNFATFGPDPWGNDEQWTGDDGPMDLGHTVTAVGYLTAADPLNPMPGTDWVIVHDNVVGTPRNVAVPMNFNVWVANTNAARNGPGVAAMSFSIDDNPAFPANGPVGVIPGYGAEDPFGLAAAGFPPGFAPSPTLTILPCIDGDILSSGPFLQSPSPNGAYIDSLSQNTIDPGFKIYLDFSVDRLSMGLAGTAVAGQWALSQQPGDIYRSTTAYVSPRTFVGTLPPGPFAGVLPAVAGGAPSNALIIDEMWPGFLAGGVPVVPTVAAGPIALRMHDNVDGFDRQMLASPPGAFVNWGYFTIYPDEALAVGASSADIFDVPPGAGATAPTPFAPALSMGLDTFGHTTDSIDALVMFDRNIPGGPAWGGPGGEPAIDFALFSLAPGSASLAAFGVDAADVLFTDFTGAFAVYAPSATLGLAGAPGGPIGADSIDALEAACHGDVDFDGDIDLSDLAIVLGSFGCVAPPACPGDTDFDGDTDLTDLAVILGAFGCKM